MIGEKIAFTDAKGNPQTGTVIDDILLKPIFSGGRQVPVRSHVIVKTDDGGLYDVVRDPKTGDYREK